MTDLHLHLDQHVMGDLKDVLYQVLVVELEHPKPHHNASEKEDFSS